MDSRRAQLREVADRRYDVIVIGGGINGAGIARDAAERGLAVLLLDQEDWGFGTTWRSTKLIHGGLRYLEHGELGLVFESLRERGVLLRMAPHLVRPLPFLLPVYGDGQRGMATLRLGLTLYDLLALGGGLPRHRALSVSATLAAEPRLDRSGLRGGLAYWDGQVELPERLCLENVLRAREAGAATLSYARVERLEAARGRVAGVSATDAHGGESYELRASLVVNAAGPWVDRVLRPEVTRQRRIGGTRGTHLVARFRDGGPRRAIYAEAARDGRPFFIIPWRGVHLIGTTDVPVEDPDATLPSDDETSYLLEAARTVLPGERLDRGDVWYAYAGIRPLPAGDGRNADAIPRRHYIIDHAADGFDGLLSVVGGKLSTYRSLAEQVVDRLERRLGRRVPSRTAAAPLVPGDWRPVLGDTEARRLWRIYGPRAGEVLALQQRDRDLARPLCPHTLETEAQAVYAIEREGAVTVGDVLLRRTPAAWSRCMGLDAAPAVATLLESHGCGTDRKQAIAAYRREVEATFRQMQ